MNENEMTQDEEINLYDLWEQLCSGWRIIAGGLALGVAIAVAAMVLIPPTYQAVAIIQVSQIGQIGQVKVAGQPVEPPVQAVERMKTPAFQRRIAEKLNDEAWLQRLDRSATENLSLQIIKGTTGPEGVPLIELRAEGDAPKIARDRAEAVVSELVNVHADLAQPAIARMRADLAINREKLASAERDLLALSKLVEAASIKDDRFTQLALITSLRIQKEAESFGQRQIIAALETALEAPATQPARTIEAIFAPDKPISPKKTLILALGVVGGLFLGVVLMFITAAWQRAKQERGDRISSR